MLSASLGTLRRAGSHWYGPEKSAPFPASAVRALLTSQLLYSSDPNTARITTRGRWCARTINSGLLANSVSLSPEEETTMANRKLTEACIFALHEISHGPTEIYNRTVANNLRAVARVFPELIELSEAPYRNQIGAQPYLCATLTARGRDFITPRKLRKAQAVSKTEITPSALAGLGEVTA
ncbi:MULTISPECIES: hypothetical protein [unclassified Bradyrhizobium]|uniref:hypothetical protein n=1 Tax=unclassified Bradyrhizobium TaxID=2631580 RepID=UPI002916AB12|nr:MULTISPECIES: hypothetical protein [unclassified Bradyrhizobium]